MKLLLKELWYYMKVKKKWWLFPFIIILYAILIPVFIILYIILYIIICICHIAAYIIGKIESFRDNKGDHN